MNIDAKALKTAMDDVERQYNQSVYDVNYINEILIAMDKPINRFTIAKHINVEDGHTMHKMAFNEYLVFAFYDPMAPYSVYTNNNPVKHFSDMNEEAFKKIKAKYLTYIARLEDSLQQPIGEILKLDFDL